MIESDEKNVLKLIDQNCPYNLTINSILTIDKNTLSHSHSNENFNLLKIEFGNLFGNNKSVLFDVVKDANLEKMCSLSPADEPNSNSKILISEKLLYTKRIWYLPFLSKTNICNRLKDKPSGNFIISGLMDTNELVLYKSADKSKINEILIEIGSDLCFWLKEDSANKFKSLIALLEYYITNNLKSKKFKLTLPNAINEATNFKILNSYSLLEQDFWRENFYYKRSEEKTKKQKTYEISPYQPTESQDNKTHFSSANLDKTKSLELLDKSEIEAEPQTIVKKRSKRKIQRVFYDPRFNSYPSAKPYYTNFFRLFKNSKKSPINTSTPTDFGSDKLTKISNLISQLQLANKSQKNETIKTNSTLNSLTNLSGTISNSKSSLNFDTISINSCLSFIDMIDTSKHLIETYSTIPNHLPNRTRTKIENRRTNVLTLYSEQNNEYSEPFDLIATESEKKKNQDDDSAYSSCYQSNMSSPRTNNVKVTSTEDEIVESFSSSCSSSAQFTNSEYESVKDVLVNNEKDLFKSTITAFDILTERCSELMELFETENSESKKALELKRRFDKYQKNKCQESQIIYSNKLSSFLKRNLSFDFYMKSSSLLSNSISLSPSSNLTSDRFNSIRNLIVKMSKNEKIIFGKNIQEFIKCTLGLKELNPFVLMSNTRQFMNGIKNYLLKNDSSNSELMSLLEKERTKLDPNEIINIDSLIEDCLQSIVLQPLKAKIYYLMVDWFITDSSMISVKHSMKFIADLSDDEACNYLNLDKQCLPNEECLKKVRNYYNRMQCEYAPFAKLKYVLIILDDLIQTISESADFELLDSRKLFCVLAYTFSKCRMYAIQIEIEYIWNLVNKNLLSCETFFYLTLISCVCQSLANINSQKHFEYESFLAEVFIESGHELKKSHIPLKIGVKCKDLTNLISSKFKIFNQNEYGLYLVRDTEFLLVKDDEKVFEIRSNRIKSRSKFYLLYKKKVSNILCSKFL